jgi:hypothetical protein
MLKSYDASRWGLNFQLFFDSALEREKYTHKIFSIIYTIRRNFGEARVNISSHF